MFEGDGRTDGRTDGHVGTTMRPHLLNEQIIWAGLKHFYCGFAPATYDDLAKLLPERNIVHQQNIAGEKDNAFASYDARTQ